MKITKIGAKELKITAMVLEFYKENPDIIGLNKEDKESIKKITEIIKREVDWAECQEAHSEITIEMEEYGF